MKMMFEYTQALSCVGLQFSLLNLELGHGGCRLIIRGKTEFSSEATRSSSTG